MRTFAENLYLIACSVLPDHLPIVAIDDRQIIRGFNDGAADCWGVPKKDRDDFIAEEVIGQPLSVLIPETFHEDHRQHVKADQQDAKAQTRTGFDQMRTMSAGKKLPLSTWDGQARFYPIKFSSFSNRNGETCSLASVQVEVDGLDIEAVGGRWWQFVAKYSDPKEQDKLLDQAEATGKRLQRLVPILLGIAGTLGVLIAPLHQLFDQIFHHGDHHTKPDPPSPSPRVTNQDGFWEFDLDAGPPNSGIDNSPEP